jgi:hypothetical protein
MIIEQCLDDRNREFYINNIASKFNVTLISSKTNSNIWLASYKDNDKNVSIIAGNDFPNIESFTHEMLHLYLFDKGFNTFYIESIEFFGKLKQNLIKPLCLVNGISNAISHYKMLPIFTEMLHMKKEKFFPSQIQYVNDNHLTNLEEKFKYDLANRTYYFTNFIRHFFDIRYHFSDSLEKVYSDYSNRLKSIDPILFNILNNNCENWENSESFDNTDFFNSMYIQLESYL